MYDFDGVMTNNKVFVDEHGTESVSCHRGDGLAVSMIKELGIRQVVLSTETNPVISARAKKIGLPFFRGVNDKLALLKKFCAEERVALKEVLYIGNDVNDLPVMKAVGYPMAPRDAHPTVHRISRYVFKTAGGDGVIRELLDLLKKFKRKES